MKTVKDFQEIIPMTNFQEKHVCFLRIAINLLDPLSANPRKWSKTLNVRAYLGLCQTPLIDLCFFCFCFLFFCFFSCTIVNQNQPSRCVLRKKCSENMQQIHRRTRMPKSDFNTVTLQLNKQIPNNM